MSKFTPGKATIAASLRPLATAELEKRIREARDEQHQLSLRRATGQLENPARLRALRRDIARCLTLIHQKAKA